MANNLNNLTIVTIYGQRYSVVKLIPLRIKVTVKAGESGVKRTVKVTPSDDETDEKNYLMSYALISPEFWIDRDATYISNEVDFGFNLKDLAIAEDFVDSGANIEVESDYFEKDKMLSDELIAFPEINRETPLMWTYWDTPQSNPMLEFISTNRGGSDYDVYFVATLIKLHVIPDDLIDPSIA